MTAVKPPCPGCPWRKDAQASEIPNFSMELAEALERDCDTGEIGAPMMACHHSKEDDEFVCAGFLAVRGWDSITVRLNLAHGLIDPAALEPDPAWGELHGSFAEMNEKLRGLDDRDG